ncbi:uncharacterized protein LOC113765590 [Coffea eugenioides]|uniref:uncharacterized protein LOC113765590 n=1 Tax=Coffea eugenioides TaxID=49369 RepID=UPI000F5CEB82|nr:uncharacterized protein LOC113737127 [Coffea arabica]XP_027120218.1 uncharacterized protein LOC113737156 [Coffea arabica]XP_027120219.1 uncharacterized protein LOC113737158 [Coffea arabica]XP_027165621.1 uncharacterized protein LOC113765590 [Coffea eugenioides]
MAEAKSATVTDQIDINSIQPVAPADPHVVGIGQFVVEKFHHGKLHFIAVIGGFTWNCEGGKYYALIIQNQDYEGATFIHKALVVEAKGETKLLWHRN